MLHWVMLNFTVNHHECSLALLVIVQELPPREQPLKSQDRASQLLLSLKALKKVQLVLIFSRLAVQYCVLAQAMGVLSAVLQLQDSRLHRVSLRAQIIDDHVARTIQAGLAAVAVHAHAAKPVVKGVAGGSRSGGCTLGLGFRVPLYILGLLRGHIGIVEKKMETTVFYGIS